MYNHETTNNKGPNVLMKIWKDGCFSKKISINRDTFSFVWRVLSTQPFVCLPDTSICIFYWLITVFSFHSTWVSTECSLQVTDSGFETWVNLRFDNIKHELVRVLCNIDWDSKKALVYIHKKGNNLMFHINFKSRQNIGSQYFFATKCLR